MSIVINHHYPNSDPDIARRLGRIEQALIQLIGNTEDIMADFTGLENELTSITETTAAVEALIQRIVDELRNDSADQAKVVDLTNKLSALKTRLATAVAANTPADPAPTP